MTPKHQRNRTDERYEQQCPLKEHCAQRENTIAMPDQPPDHEQLEQAARAALEARCSRPLTDDEWAAAKRNLLGLARALRDAFENGRTDDAG